MFTILKNSAIAICNILVIIASIYAFAVGLKEVLNTDIKAAVFIFLCIFTMATWKTSRLIFR